MNWLDFLLLALVGLSALLSLWRGFFKEALSLITWLVALWVALLYFRPLGDMLSGMISSPTVRHITGFAALFMGTLLLGGVLNYLVAQLVSKTGLSATDRALGIVFGLVRGVLIAGLVVLLAGLTTLPRESWWADSLLVGYFQDLAVWMRSFLPDNIAQHIEF